MESYDVLKYRNMDTHEVNEKELNDKEKEDGNDNLIASDRSIEIKLCICIATSIKSCSMLCMDTGLQLYLYSSIFDKGNRAKCQT